MSGQAPGPGQTEEQESSRRAGSDPTVRDEQEARTGGRAHTRAREEPGSDYKRETQSEVFRD